MKLREYILCAKLFMQGLRSLGFKQKYLNLCTEDEQRAYEFGGLEQHEGE